MVLTFSVCHILRTREVILKHKNEKTTSSPIVSTIWLSFLSAVLIQRWLSIDLTLLTDAPNNLLEVLRGHYLGV